MTGDAFEKLYAACYMRVFSYVMTLACDRSQAEEITQETFFRAFARRESYRAEADEVTWLCAIAKNLFLDARRRQAKHGEMPADAADPARGVEQQVTDRDSSFRIHMALHALDEPYREVFELRVFGELSFAQIGEIFAKGEGWARVTYHRARLKLRERMGET